MKETITIRKAFPADAGPIHELHLRSVRQLCCEVYSLETIEGWLANRTPQGYLPGINRNEMYVAESEGRMVAGSGTPSPAKYGLYTSIQPLSGAVSGHCCWNTA
jgi:hypothetical protein